MNRPLDGNREVCSIGESVDTVLREALLCGDRKRPTRRNRGKGKSGSLNLKSARHIEKIQVLGRCDGQATASSRRTGNLPSEEQQHSHCITTRGRGIWTTNCPRFVFIFFQLPSSQLTLTTIGHEQKLAPLSLIKTFSDGSLFRHCQTPPQQVVELDLLLWVPESPQHSNGAILSPPPPCN